MVRYVHLLKGWHGYGHTEDRMPIPTRYVGVAWRSALRHSASETEDHWFKAGAAEQSHGLTVTRQMNSVEDS